MKSWWCQMGVHSLTEVWIGPLLFDRQEWNGPNFYSKKLVKKPSYLEGDWIVSRCSREGCSYEEAIQLKQKTQGVQRDMMV